MKRMGISGCVLAVALLCWASAVFAPRKVRAAASDCLLTGSVQSASGEKMAGVTVSARRVGSNITTSVFTDGQGNYYFPAMDSGKYKVWAQADSYQYTSAAVDLTNVEHQNFVLKPMADYFQQLTGDQVLASLPGSTPNDRRMKRIFRNNCTSCHQPNYILQNRFDEAGWTAILNLMRYMNGSPQWVAEGYWYINAHKQALADYLARMRGPGPSAMKIHLRLRPAGKAARVVWTEYNIPEDTAAGYPYKYFPDDGSDWSLGTPSRLFGNGGIHDGVADLEGNIWFTVFGPDTTIGRVDGETGAVKFFKVTGRNGLRTASHGMTRDLHGNIWFNAGAFNCGPGGIAMIDPRTQEIHKYYAPQGMVPPSTGSLDTDAKGNVWVTTCTGALLFNTTTKQFTEFKSPIFHKNAPRRHGRGRTYGLTVDSEGNGWWAQYAIDIVDKANIKTGKVTAIHLPPVKSQLNNVTPEDRKLYAEHHSAWNSAVPWAEGPRRLGADRHGDYVWVGDYWGGNLAKININTLKVTIVPLPQPDAQQPYQVKVDDHHNVWTNLMDADAVMEYDPQTSKWTLYPMPTLGAESRYIDLLEKNGSPQVIVPYSRSRKVARMTFRTRAEIQALKKQVEQREQAAK
ncbi:MAG TPA: carboxypeptidase regulatory-like domain-containing protein [Patescibacteria group bacterium]|nr:carboxypeptidase regulatory-like domain-containing protein [Patescibacteria group bacterium]